MPVRNTTILRFDTGIEEILRAEEFEPLFLPKEVESLLPSETHVVTHLEQVVHLPSFDTYLLEDLRPKITHKEVLLPTKYKALMQASLDVLQAEIKSSSEKDTLQRAITLFKEENELFSLFSFFTNLLLKA
jgi:type III secretion protein X